MWLCASNRAPKTIAAYRGDLLHFVRNLPRSCTPGAVRRDMIENWVARLQKERYATTSIRRKLASLRAFFGYLVATGQLSQSPLSQLHIRLGAVKRLTRVVSRRALRSLMRSADQRAKPSALRGRSGHQRLMALRNALVVRLLGGTGIRVGELVALRMCDLQSADRALLVHGKGNRERLAFVIDSATCSLLRRYLRERGLPPTDASALFVDALERPLSTDQVRGILKGLGDAAHLATRITPHMLRHTAATAMLENGADLRVVQEFLGHDSIRSTERYTHVARGHFLRVLRRAHPLKRVA